MMCSKVAIQQKVKAIILLLEISFINKCLTEKKSRAFVVGKIRSGKYYFYFYFLYSVVQTKGMLLITEHRGKSGNKET